MFKTRRRWTTRLAALSLIAAGSLVALTPTAAFAASCTTWLATDRAGAAICWDAPGGYQAWVGCEENSGNYYWHYGPWTYDGDVSVAYCDEFSWAFSYGVNV